ncbi:unnamed protein product [Callosobruchus maculatus]|uniref:Beta-galactosidase n=2 Tax=Callosobruchus maculatus TaxID=64391 RepID=A0A653BQ80_CALMS|nr:unnamed protein product [Callosobruchus maculatus]
MTVADLGVFSGSGPTGLNGFNLLPSNLSNPTAGLPTNYEYFTQGGIQGGLNADGPRFKLNGKEMFVYSGAFHYFRVPRPYWRDRLRKMRAAGLNTVETYVPWNLHEPRSGQYDFGDGGNDMSDFLHLQEFMKIAKEEDLFVIARSGPFICAEFEFGGLPSWLLRESDIEVRTSNPTYMKYVTRFFSVLMPILAALQFTKGGPIIAFQVENEYSISGKHDLEYLKLLRNEILSHGITELLVTSDNPGKGTYGSLPDLFLMTGNFDDHIEGNLIQIQKNNLPNRPIMVMEYWGGWMDFWGDNHTEKGASLYRYNYEHILKHPASVNVYMFVGGTNFGFLNGAQNFKYDDWNTDYHSITSSYDYLSPISEAGDTTEKYWITKELLEKYNPIKTRLPEVPPNPKKIAYANVKMTQELYLDDLLKTIEPTWSKNVVPMENLNINDNSGQSYGYIVYRKTDVFIPANGSLLIEGRICDTAMILVNGILVSPWLQKSADLNKFGTSMILNSYITLSDKELRGATIDIVVENWGRVNVGTYKQFKGLWQGQVKLNGAYLYDWAIYPLEFKAEWTRHLGNWRMKNTDSPGPVLYRGYLKIDGTPQDTFVHMEKWTKGIVIVNGFVLGRYAHMGPIQTLYLPATILRNGSNTIDVFEHYKGTWEVEFSDKHVYQNY